MEDLEQWRPRTLAELQQLPDDVLVKLHDATARDWVDYEYYLAEIRHRQQERLARVMVRLTIAVSLLTGIVTLATLYNVFWS